MSRTPPLTLLMAMPSDPLWHRFSTCVHRLKIGAASILLGPLSVVLLFATNALAVDPYADAVIGYAPGVGAPAAFQNPQVALGEPSRATGGLFPGVVSVFSSPYLPDQIVSIGDGGFLTVRFDEPLTNDPGHPYGVDLIVFGNAGFIEDGFGSQRLTDPAGLYGPGAGKVEVSADGVEFYEIRDVLTDRLFPTQGYLDAGPYDVDPGMQLTDFRRPVNPALQLSDLNGLSYAQILALYDGSGGGTPIDLAGAVDALGQPVALTSVSYVRISHTGGDATEVDALVAVPEPATAILLVLASLACMNRPRRRVG